MAEIDIERKKRPIWPWLLALLLIAVGVWIAVEMIETEPEPAVTEVTVPGEQPEEEEMQPVEEPAEVPGEVESYFSFVEDSSEMGLPHDYTSRGLMKLATALETVVQKYDTENKVSAENAVQEIRSKANFIEKNPESLHHADSIKAAFVEVQNVLQELENAYPELQTAVSGLDEEVEQLESGPATLEQKPAVKSMFEETKKVLEEVVEKKPVNL